MSKALLKGLLGMALVSALGLVYPALVSAQENYPNKPVTLVVAYPPGGTADLMGRLVGKGLSKELGQTILIENKPGGATVVASEYVAQAPADGYTLLSASSSALTIAPLVYKDLPFEVADFQPIAGMATAPFVLAISTDLPVKTAKEFVAYAKERPGKLNYYQLSFGSMQHLFTEMLLESMGIKAVPVSFQGEAPAFTSLLANEIQFMPATPSAALLELYQAGKIRIIAVADEERSPTLPEVPTFREAGLNDLVASAWFGILGPKGLPDIVVRKVERAMENALKDEELRARLEATGTVPRASTAAQLAQILEAQAALWGPVVKRLGISLER